MSRKGKRTVILILAALMIILLFTIRLQLKDGGTVEYRAVLYKVSKVHRLTEEKADSVKPYDEGLIIRIFGLEIYNDVK